MEKTDEEKANALCEKLIDLASSRALLAAEISQFSDALKVATLSIHNAALRCCELQELEYEYKVATASLITRKYYEKKYRKAKYDRIKTERIIRDYIKENNMEDMV